MPDAIAIVDAAMRDFSSGRVGSPQRTVMSVNPATRLGLMPGAMPDLGRFGLKVVSLSSDAPKYRPAQSSRPDAVVRRCHGPAAGALESMP